MKFSHFRPPGAGLPWSVPLTAGGFDGWVMGCYDWLFHGPYRGGVSYEGEGNLSSSGNCCYLTAKPFLIGDLTILQRCRLSAATRRLFSVGQIRFAFPVAYWNGSGKRIDVGYLILPSCQSIENLPPAKVQ